MYRSPRRPGGVNNLCIIIEHNILYILYTYLLIYCYAVGCPVAGGAVRRRRYHRGLITSTRYFPVLILLIFDVGLRAVFSCCLCLIVVCSCFCSLAIVVATLYYYCCIILNILILLFSTHSKLCARAHTPPLGETVVLPNSGLFGRLRSEFLTLCTTCGAQRISHKKHCTYSVFMAP